MPVLQAAAVALADLLLLGQLKLHSMLGAVAGAMLCTDEKVRVNDCVVSDQGAQWWAPCKTAPEGGICAAQLLREFLAYSLINWFQMFILQSFLCLTRTCLVFSQLGYTLCIALAFECSEVC